MRLIRRAASEEPAATAAVLSWAAGLICTLFGKPEFAPVLVAVGLAFLGVRAKVTPTAIAQATTDRAASTAAIEVAKNLTDGTAGPVGEITNLGGRVVDEALALVAGLTGRRK